MPIPDLTYAAQFEVLSVWIGSLQPGELASPSVLPGWTVADLVSHLAGTGTTIAALRAADDEVEPMTVADYVGNYASSAEAIGQLAKDTTVAAGPDLLARFGAAHAQAERTLDELGNVDRIVVSRRGPILLSDFMETRLIELVVHSGDLARSLPGRKSPTVLPTAQRRVLAVLRELLTAKADDPVEALAAASKLEPTEFIELSAGRKRPTDDLAPALSKALPLF